MQISCLLKEKEKPTVTVNAAVVSLLILLDTLKHFLLIGRRKKRVVRKSLN